MRGFSGSAFGFGSPPSIGFDNVLTFGEFSSTFLRMGCPGVMSVSCNGELYVVFLRRVLMSGESGFAAIGERETFSFLSCSSRVKRISVGSSLPWVTFSGSSEE